MMELRSITAGYGGAPVLNGVSLTFAAGQVTVLVGPNGCGKSTLLRVAARLLSAESGEILLDGREAGEFSNKEFARQVAFLPQSRSTPDIAAGTLVLHGRFPYLGYPRRYSAKDRQRARRAMEQAGVLELERCPVSSLSGGQRQKVYLAMALAQDTPVLLLDEPTTFLDVAHQLELVHLARELAARGKAVVMVLHDLNLALTCADAVALLSGGVLRQAGTPEEIYQSGALEQVFQVSVHRVTLEDGSIQYLFSRRG